MAFIYEARRKNAKDSTHSYLIWVLIVSCGMLPWVNAEAEFAKD